MIKYPIGVQDFETVINDDFIYVDKTMYIRSLVSAGRIYFLGRPRRFGKSLLLSTMHAFFEGKRELFKGLAIDEWDEWDWAEYPVIRIDLNAKDYTRPESLQERINEHLKQYEQMYDVETPDNSLDGRFRALIQKAYEVTGRRVVVLIDEYDKPILDTFHDDSMKDMHRDTLRAFYSVLKSVDQYLKFCFLTGVTKFGQLSIFSGLNNLQDISLQDEFAGICGITEAELHTYFDIGIRQCADHWECSLEDAYENLKYNYDGYHFSASLLDVYNPWSVLNAVKSRIINFYWNASGGPMTLIYNLLKAGRLSLWNFDDITCPIRTLQGINVSTNNSIALMYQSGYLTIKSYNREDNDFTLKFPNYEVKTGFLDGLLPAYSGVPEDFSTFEIGKLVADIRKGKIEEFLERMQAFFADFPYENALKTEKDFQNIMYCVTSLLGLLVQMEKHSSMGRADMIVETKEFVYIFEFKVDKSPEEALAQIEAKGYAERFAKDRRRLFKVGVEFSLASRNISRWQILTD